MTNKKSAQQLIEDARRRMEQIYEYSFYSHGTYEASEQGADPMAAAGGAPAPGADPMAAGGAMPGTDPAAMGTDPNAAAGGLAPNAGMPGDPNAAAGGAMPGADPMAAGGDPNAMGGDPAAMGADPMAGGMPGVDPMAGGMSGDPNAMGADPNAMGGDPMAGGMPGDPMAGGDNNVIEISQLTDTQQQMQQAQDEQSEKLDGVDKKITSLMSIVDKFTQALSANDEKISELKRELQKRTPTEEETMNVRLHAGGNPFEEKPEEFWDRFKDINNHYNITTNNDAPQYQIKKGDVDNVNDRLVGSEFDDDEFDRIPNTLKEYFIR